MNENIFVIIPSLNPDERLINTVNGMLDIGFKRIIIVNDGSDKSHLKYFPKADENITVIHRKQNHGKGAALKVAFRHILRNYPNAVGAVTVDGDGQHLPEDALACANALDNTKKRVILGCRDFSGEDVPGRSRMGNRITSGVFKVLCGMSISDTQTGLRAYPASLFGLLLSVKGDRFEYETNMLLKFKQRGVAIKEIPIETVYLDENSSSHFRPVRDSLKIYRFILSYILSSGISFIIDILLFYIASRLLKSALVGAAVGIIVYVYYVGIDLFAVCNNFINGGLRQKQTRRPFCCACLFSHYNKHIAQTFARTVAYHKPCRVNGYNNHNKRRACR